MKRTLFAVLTLSAGILSAQNLIQNSDFDDRNTSEYRFDYVPGTMKKVTFTEDRTWNKCLRIECVKHSVDKQGRKYVNISCWIGKDGKLSGFKAEPNTVYEFQFECKGNIAPRVWWSEWDGPDFWKNMKRKKVQMEKQPAASAEWTIIRGSFVTSHKAQRAALNISIEGSEQWKSLPPIGSYIMIDKVKVEKKKSLLAAHEEVKLTEKAVTVPCMLPGKTYGDFVLPKSDRKAKAQSAVSCVMKDGKMIVDFRCLDPDMSKLAANVSENGGKVWNDDSVEIFFSSGDPNRIMNQFVIAAGGGRWMSRGGTDSLSEFDAWTATVKKEKDAWTVHAEFPLSLLGWNKPPAPGETILFFAARNRVTGNESSAMSIFRNGFRDKKSWAVFLPYGLQTWFDAAKKDLLAKAASYPALAEKIRNWKSTGDPKKDYAAAESFKAGIADMKLAGRKFILTCNPITENPEIPFLPSGLQDPPKKISFRAAVNDRVFVPLAITNLTGRAEDYRILITALDKWKDEKNCLETADGRVYPVDKMTMFQAIRVKDGDEKGHGFRYDPLVPMNVAHTVTVLPRESAPVWVLFNTRDVAPGIYKGVVRVIPLGEAVIDNKSVYRDIPFSFEVLPFALSKDGPTPYFCFQEALTKACFQLMLDSSIDTFTLSPNQKWFSFDENGNLTGRNTEKVEKRIQQYQAWEKEFKVEGKIHYCVCYNVYWYFMKYFTGGKLKVGTPEWEKAWITCLKELDSIRVKYNIPLDHWSIELKDEPKEESLPELIKASEVAAKACPGVRYMMTLAAWPLPPKELMKLVPYIHIWDFWSTRFFTYPEYAPLIAELRARKKFITTYTCSTSMREDLQRYYRRLPWTVPCFNLDGCSFYQHTTYRYKSSDWKKVAHGEIALFAGDHMATTIRGECLHAGIADLKYWNRLKEALKEAGEDSPVGKEIREFMKKTPNELVRALPKNRTFDDTREKMIDLILKASKH